MNNKRKKHLADDGITLIEILLSMVIISIILLSFSAMFIQSARTNQQTESTMDATYIAQKCIEEVINKSIEGSGECPVTKSVTPAQEYSHTYTGTVDRLDVYINIVDQNGKAIVKVFRRGETDLEKTPLAQIETIIQ